MAVVHYALGRQCIDLARYLELRQAIPRTPHEDVPELVGDLPVPRWDQVPVTDPVDDLERDFAKALLEVAYQAEVLSGAERRWRTVFAANARTTGDLLVLFLDTEPYLIRRRKDPALATRLERLAFVPKIFDARSRGKLSRPELVAFLERTASGEDLDALRAELDVPQRPRAQLRTPAVAEPVPTTNNATKAEEVKAAAPRRRPAPTTKTRGVRASAPDRPVTDVDRARIAKHLQNALADERLSPGEHAIRTVALWSATTTPELAVLIVDLPAPANEPLRDRKPDAYLDDLITPAHRQSVIDRLGRVMADDALTLWEYEARLQVALNARTFEELGHATADLPPGW